MNTILSMLPFNNYKTLIGSVGLVVCYVLTYYGIHVPDIAYKASEALAGLGIVHKLEKVRDDVKQLNADLTDGINSVNDTLKTGGQK